MQNLWEGKQIHVRYSKIECEERFIGPYTLKLYPGDTQTTVFSENDKGAI
jgi:hypothetical protein